MQPGLSALVETIRPQKDLARDLGTTLSFQRIQSHDGDERNLGTTPHGVNLGLVKSTSGSKVAHLSAVLLLLRRLPLIVVLLALTDAELELGPAV